jgi:phosphatidylserine decarboxylase
MKIPLTKYGWPQVVVVPVIVFAAMVFIALGAIKFLPLWLFILIEILLAGLLIFSLAFFRDPERNCPSEANLLLAPADGRITEIENIDNVDSLGGNAIRIGIFLSIFNTHINRSPCNVSVEKITYKKGKYKNAMDPESGRVNEANELELKRTDNPESKLLVRQISGAIARRIVCRASKGQKLAMGEKFGMIKFGSRTELYVPVHNSQYQVKCLVKIGDTVKAGLTPLMRYEKCQE